MGPDGELKTFWEKIRMDLFLLVHRCYDCGRIMFYTPLCECKDCFQKNVTAFKSIEFALEHLGEESPQEETRE